MKVTYVHFGADEDEIGLQFSADDGAGGTVVGRAFRSVDPALKKAVFDAAQAALNEAAAELPVDMPPAAVTTALMKKRNAEQEARRAELRREEAEIAQKQADRQAAEAALTTAKAEAALTAIIADAGQVAARKAEDEALLADWMAKREQARADAVAAERAAEAKRAEAAAAETARHQAATEMAAALAAIEEARAQKAAIEAEIAAAEEAKPTADPSPR